LKFRWSEKTYPRNKQVSDLIADLAARIATNDNSIKNCMNQQSDLKSRQNALAKRAGNLLTIDLDDVLTDKLVSHKDFPESALVKTIVIVTHNKYEQELVSKY
jgi:hypothetical protein